MSDIVGESGPKPVCGVLELDLGAAAVIVAVADGAQELTVVCRRRTWLAERHLRRRLGGRLRLLVLDRDPYHLPAQDMCDEHRRNFRCDAIESVIAVDRAMVDELRDELDATLAAGGIRETGDVFRRFLRHQAGDEVREQVYLGYHLLSRMRTNGHSRAVLFLPALWWREYFQPVFEGTGLDIGRVPAKTWLSAMVSLTRRLVRPPSAKAYVETSHAQVDQSGLGRAEDFGWLSTRLGGWQGVRASGIALDGLDAGLRNNLEWAWRSDLPLDALAIFWAVRVRPASAWEREFGKLGGHIVCMGPGQVACESRFELPSRSRRIARLAKGGLGIVFSRPGLMFSARGRWLAANMVILLTRSAEWRSVFSRMSVRVHVEFDYGVEAYARAFAMRTLGGVVILDQRSHYYDNYDHTSDRSGDLAFLSGPCSLRYFSPRLFEVGGIVMTGLGRDGGEFVGQPARRDSGAWDGPTVAVLDEPGTLYGPEHAIRFVSSMIGHCASNGGYRLVMKPKRKDELISKIPAGVANALNRLIEEDRAHILPSFTPVANVCEMSDVVVSLPSTAAYIAIGVGRVTLVYNPFHTIRTAFYEHGLDGQCVFVDLDVMLARLDRVLDDRQFGAQALAKMRKTLDPWLDMNGNERKGYFVSQLVCHLSGTAGKTEAIMMAMTDYRQRYGEASCGDWQSVWDGASAYADGLATYPPRFDRVDSTAKAMA